MRDAWFAGLREGMRPANGHPRPHPQPHLPGLLPANHLDVRRVPVMRSPSSDLTTVQRRYYRAAMPIKRHTLHLDTEDLKALGRLARAETKATGIRVTAAGMVRRLVKEYLPARRDATTSSTRRR